MRKIFTFALTLVLVLNLGLPALAADREIVTTPSGYTSAEEVVHETFSGNVQVTASTSYAVENVIINWGARGENATFLTTYAENYYTGYYLWKDLSVLPGGTGASDAYTSDLYDALQRLMTETHSKETNYQETRAYYQFTDCLLGDYSEISSFYSGGMVAGQWTGKTYNREHTWPNSKGLGGNDENDIMMLRPTLTSENSSRGNKAYGESAGYFDPGVDVRGDCARIVLYTYVRWGNINYMWGTSGVMESVDVLLKWMAEDPVDTWEMGRNDSVQSITGVRNVFVDYPEYAWLLFGQEVPTDLVTPSGMAAKKPCQHENTLLRDAVEPQCVLDGYSGDAYCADCDVLLSIGTVLPATGKHILDQNGHCTTCDFVYACQHTNVTQRGEKEATCGQAGYSGDTYCADCGEALATGSEIPATGQHTLDEVGHCTRCSYTDDHISNDISPAFWVLIGLGVAAVVVVILVVIKKKR